MSSERLQRITRLLNKNFYHMTFEDKKKVLSLVVTEKECDNVLTKFLASQYNTDKAPKSSGQVYKHSINDELEDIASEYSTPTPASKPPKKTSAPQEPSDDESDQESASESDSDVDEPVSDIEDAGSDESDPESDPEVEYEYVNEEDVNSDDEVEYI